jgi:hypothetical protein
MQRKLIIGTQSVFREYKKHYPEDDVEFIWHLKQLDSLIDDNSQSLPHLFQEIIYLGNIDRINQELMDSPLLIDLESQLPHDKVSHWSLS